MYLIDALGRQVAVAPLNVAKGEAIFELTGLAGGVYIVRCGAVAEPVLIQRQVIPTTGRGWGSSANCN